MLHTALGQVAPTLLPPPWSHDLSTGFRAAPFLTPSSRHTHIIEGQTRGPAGHKQADKTSKQWHIISTVILYLHIYTHTHPQPPPSPASPTLARQQQQPGVRVLRALIRGAGPIGKDH